MTVEIVEARRGSRDAADFLRLPFEIYRHTPQWVPPLMPAERRRFSPDFAFYKHSEAAFFLARDERGHPVGRVAVLEHRPHNAYRAAHDALLYLYEAFDNDKVAARLFDAAGVWAAGRGLKRLVGPKGFLTVGEGLGLLIEGFEYRPAFGIPYNPPYYARQWTDVGKMSKVVDYVSGYSQRAGYTYPPGLDALAERVKARRRYTVPQFKTKADIVAHAGAVQAAYNAAFAKLWSYTPIPDEDIEGLIDRLTAVADPKLIKLIFDGDRVIGFVFCYPDIGEGLQKIRGEVWPFGWVTLLRERSRMKWINLNGVAILPEYQHMGANVILYSELAKTLTLETRYQFVDIVQIQEDNATMLGDLDKLFHPKIYKRHRVYSKDIG